MTDAPSTSHLVGARIRRLEDRRLTTGEARYLDDLEMPGALHIRLVRSPYAHARIIAIDAASLSEASQTSSSAANVMRSRATCG